MGCTGPLVRSARGLSLSKPPIGDGVASIGFRSCIHSCIPKCPNLSRHQQTPSHAIVDIEDASDSISSFLRPSPFLHQQPDSFLTEFLKIKCKFFVYILHAFAQVLLANIRVIYEGSQYGREIS